MRTPRAVRLALLLLTALPLAGAARADDAGDLLARARKNASDVPTPGGAPAAPAARSCTDGISVSMPGKFCESLRDCQRFCSCACTFDPHQWKPDVKNDGSTSCPGAPKTGPGMLPPDSPDLTRLADAGLNFITFPSSERAAPAALEGLKRLDAHLAASESRKKFGYSVRVVSCYRPQIDDTEAECGFTLKSQYMLARVSDPKQKAYWEEKGDPNNLGLAWPGRTPHSGGYACDLILVDRNGRDSFDSRAGVDGAPSSSIDQRLASKMLDAEVTNPDVGGSRLTFEAWHYEWASGIPSRCKDPECADKYWPVKGTP